MNSLISLLLLISGTVKADKSVQLLQLKIVSSPSADSYYTKEFVSKFQICDKELVKYKKDIKKEFGKGFSFHMTLEVSQKGRIKSAFIPRDINESEIRKKWLNCITKQTFKL
ncbi:MAG: hypothetical protein KDD58_14710, partial [Bdellovibrionales bacterium]|nr:hypothetical protein [Bdellovibrionales bacterium]